MQDLTGVNSIDSNLFAFEPSNVSNDGDGLIDCEDPFCSGYGKCNVTFIKKKYYSLGRTI